ncbi:transcriptional attenuator, LytR family [Selenomonas sp. GACV-9]|uniref:LCP family protein n=1 Tax=Selenomonas sp. GACV-9 TaxID=3158782 RepID=UPI0008EA264A|nr:transcriptional attenuator, LytR family [Selenomonas ruminantium]
MENEQQNITRENIMRKRQLRARRRRRALVRLFFLLIFLGAVTAGVLFVGYTLVSWGSNLYHEYQTMYNGYTERQQARRGSIDPKFDGYTNVLVMGLDEGADEAEGNVKRADTILVVSLENETGKVRFINIPRDTWVNLPEGGNATKLKSVYALGGSPMMVRQVSGLLGISIHQYVAMDMAAFADLIDALGGIDLYVEEDMQYEDPEADLSIQLKQGYQHLTGQQAQQYLRYRSSELGDVGRVQRQQKFVKALYQKLLQFETIPKLPAVADIFKQRIDTSAEIFDSAHLANVLRSMSSDTPVSVMLPGSVAQDDDTIWVPDEAGIQKRMQELFPADTWNKSEEE